MVGWLELLAAMRSLMGLASASISPGDIRLMNPEAVVSRKPEAASPPSPALDAAEPLDEPATEPVEEAVEEAAPAAPVVEETVEEAAPAAPVVEEAVEVEIKGNDGHITVQDKGNKGKMLEYFHYPCVFS